MNSSLKKVLLGFVIPVAIIFIIALFNVYIALIALAIYILRILYKSRSLLFSILGVRNYNSGKLQKALKWYEMAYKAKKPGIRAGVTYAYVLLKTGNLEKSEQLLQKLLKDNPQSEDLPLIKSNLSLVLWKKGELDAAIEMLEDLMQTYETTSLHGSLGYLLILKGDLEKALEFNLKAHEFNKRDKIIRDNLGQNYYLLGNYDKAKEIYDALVADAPSFPEPYFNYGLVLEKLGETESALDMMKKALTYKFTYLSSISREEVEASISEISSRNGGSILQ